MPFIVATYVYASSQGQRTHSSRTNVISCLRDFVLTTPFLPFHTNLFNIIEEKKKIIKKNFCQIPWYVINLGTKHDWVLIWFLSFFFFDKTNWVKYHIYVLFTFVSAQMHFVCYFATSIWFIVKVWSLFWQIIVWYNLSN